MVQFFVSCCCFFAFKGCKKPAREILSKSGVKGGFIVHLGCGDGKFTAALRADNSYIVQGLDKSKTNIKQARQHIYSRGLYGPVSVRSWNKPSLPYADNLVNLLVCEQPLEIPMEKVMRVLCPNGVAYIKHNGKWVKKVKPSPDDIDEWTHYLHGPGNNAVAKDTRIGPPRRLQWKSDPMWCRSHDGVPSSINLVLSAGGRLFVIIDEGLTGQPGLPARWTLVARDAFNGTLLWKKRLSRKTEKKALVSIEDKLYLASGQDGPLQIIDAATGKTIHTVKDTKGSNELVCKDNILVLHRDDPEPEKEGLEDSIIAINADSGRFLWQKPVKQFIRHSLAAAADRVCYHNAEQIVCLNVKSGQEIWRTECRKTWMLMIYQGVVLCPARDGLQAFDLKTGEFLWQGPKVNRRLGLFGTDSLVWVTDIKEPGRTFLWTPAEVVANGYDPGTGTIKQSVTVSKLATPGHHIRCYPAKATERYLLLPKRGVEFLDLRGENHMRHNWLRAPCRHGVMPANGLLYMPPHQCFCYAGVKLAGFNALSSDVTGEIKQLQQKKSERLEQGPAYRGEVPDANFCFSEADWPTYRHDARRSGHGGCEPPVKLKWLWEKDLGGRLSQPVVDDGKILVAEEDAHTIHCLDATSGESLWKYTAGGRIDSPPTLYHNAVLFGSTDGRAYCLRAADGELIWRFHAAPGERSIIVREQPESAWPVHGNVLIQDNVAYFTAGRSSFLKDGIWMYGLEPMTGKVLHQHRFESQRPDVTRQAGRPFDMEGARTDLLVSDGEDLYMFFQRFGLDLSPKETPRITKLGDREVGKHLMSNAGFLDKTWFDRNYWIYSCRWPGYYFGYNAPKVGQILVFDKDTTYGLHVFTTRQGHSPRFWPGKKGYELFADRNTNKPVLRPTAIGREKGNGLSRSLPARWSVRIPVRARAMVLAGQNLYLAGPPDTVSQKHPMAAFQGRLGARLWVVSASDGRKLAEYKVNHLPVFDGLIAAQGCLYMSSDDGHLICMGKKH